ncbi:MAG: response regulator [bacterium]|nr:response regulator [bacterium]
MDILIAEDDGVSRRLLETLLVKQGHRPVVCKDGIEAWEKIQKEETPRLAILDWMMPRMSGVDVCKRVRELPHSQRIYILLLTALGEKKNIVEGLEAGANDYLTKPFDTNELKARIQVGVRMVELREQLLETERLRALMQTAGAAAHEINQPLTVLIATADMELATMSEDDPYRATIERFKTAGERISKIVQKMESVKQYVTKSYIRGVDIVDFEASGEKEADEEK